MTKSRATSPCEQPTLEKVFFNVVKETEESFVSEIKFGGDCPSIRIRMSVNRTTSDMY